MAYCTVTDIENRIAPNVLAALCNDTTGAPSYDSDITDALIARASTLIDTEAGTVYSVPFGTTPDIIKEIAIDFVCYFAYQRRVNIIAMPPEIGSAYRDAKAKLTGIADQVYKLNATPTVTSNDAKVTSQDRIFTFNDTSTNMSFF